MTRFHVSDPTYPLFSIFAFLGFLLALVPLPWHFQAWNSGTCWYIFWAALSSIRITMGASVALPAASLCINRRLYQIATVRTVVITRADKRRAVLIDSLICGLFPSVYVALQYIVQGHRFNIMEDLGCLPDIYNTIPSYFISMMWPLVIGLVSAVYCAPRCLRPAHVRAPRPHPPARYLRLTALASTDLLLTTPLAAFSIYLNATATGIKPWISWADTHFDFGRVVQVPRVLWAANTNGRVALELTRWSAPLFALVFFALFGFAEEAQKHYMCYLRAVGAAFWRVLAFVGVRRPATGIFAAKSTTSSSTLGSGSVSSKGIGGSFTAASFDADIKRAGSFAGSSRTTTSTTRTASSSRFVEGFEKDSGDVVSVSSVYSADGHVDANASIASSLAAASAPSPFLSTFHPDPETPASATSFATSTSSGSGSRASHQLPLHLGWAEHAYPASPTSAGHYTTDGEGDGEWTPTSDAHSIHMAAYPHEEEQAQAERGPHARSLV
ncbi:STE3-domain-containing protein [Mycena olivaceomarginata]|nr:STE3-domain-containing protein [Mycena olivaceomarginata]